MESLLLALLINVMGIIITAYILPGVKVSNFGSAVLAAIVLGLLNVFVRPFLVFITIPLTIFTFGLFILFGGAYWLSTRRGDAAQSIGIGILIATAIEVLFVLLARSQFISQNLGQYYTSGVAAAVFDSLTKPLWLLIFFTAMVGITGIVLGRRYLTEK